ncbi:MAG: thioredoxin family protein [Flavobacteriales bacterium]
MNHPASEKIVVPDTHYTYSEYIALIEKLLAEGKVTGNQQSDSLVEYTRLNMHRLHRWEKTWQPDSALTVLFAALKQPLTWIIITEGWCGDAAQQIPVFEKLAALNEFVHTRYVLRDEHPEFMDKFLTNGSRSIPVVICLNESNEVFWKWGPRPQEAVEMLNKLKSEGMEEAYRKKELHAWYAKNKHKALQSEIYQLMRAQSSIAQ